MGIIRVKDYCNLKLLNKIKLLLTYLYFESLKLEFYNFIFRESLNVIGKVFICSELKKWQNMRWLKINGNGALWQENYWCPENNSWNSTLQFLNFSALF